MLGEGIDYCRFECDILSLSGAYRINQSHRSIDNDIEFDVAIIDSGDPEKRNE